jgi:hypothetical protein
MKNRIWCLPLFFLLVASCLFSTPAQAQSGGGWQVIKADWGVGNRWMDVTNQVRRLLSTNRVVMVTPDTVGGDPAYGVIKTLRIQARNSRGQTQQFTYRENSTINGAQFAGGGPGGGYPGGPGGGYPGGPGGGPGGGYPGQNPNYGGGNSSLQITRASYGLNNRNMDVTQRLRGMVRNGMLVVQVNNNTMGGDPAKGGDKVLTVIYRVQGRERTATVKEGNTLRIP